MTIRYMRRFFDPKSIAVIGGSEREMSLGGYVLRNLLDAGFPGDLTVVNRRGGDTVLGVRRYSRVSALPEPPDLAIICTGPAAIPGLVDELGKKGAHAVLILIGGTGMPAPLVPGPLGSAVDLAHSLLGIKLESGKTLKEATWEAARSHDLRIMGPNCMGVVVPARKLNASYAHCMVPGGSVAYVGQSAMLGTVVMDWAMGRGVGLSLVTTVGDSLDITGADVLEYLADDPGTRAILLQVEFVRSGRRFISALRAAARRKLVLVMKSFRVPASEEDPGPPTPGLLNADVIYDAVLRRTGVLRVERTDEVYSALETLTRMSRLHGERLAIVTNGTGLAFLARDHFVLSGGTLARLSDDTLSVIADDMPPFWVGDNPVDLYGNARTERYVGALDSVLADPGVDAVLVLHAPTVLAPSLETAEAVIAAVGKARKPVLTSWMGGSTAQAGRAAFDAAGIPTYDTPEQAVDAFLHMARYRRNQEQLAETPPRPDPRDPHTDHARVWALVGDALNAGRSLLTDEESACVLANAGIPVAESRYAADVAGLLAEAREVEPHFAIKVLNDVVGRPFGDSGPEANPWRGIALDLGSVEEVEAAAAALEHEARQRFPELPVQGFKLQRMRRGLNSLQVSMGITRDPVFGPLLFFGTGGNPTSAMSDRQVALPPLNVNLAKRLIHATAAGQALGDYGAGGGGSEPPPPALPAHEAAALLDERADTATHVDTLAAMLVRLGRLVVDVPVLEAVEINPLIVNREGCLALEARIALGEPVGTAIAPYPAELEEYATLPRSGRRVLLRPIRDEDAPAHAAFVSRLSPEAIRFRFFQPRSSFTRIELAQATQIDYSREMAFIAAAEGEDGKAETLGVVRAWTDPDNVRAEFAVIVDDAMRGEGLGRRLIEKMIEYVRQRGTLELFGTVLPDNRPMLGLASRLGFASRFSEDDDAVLISLRINEPTDDWQRSRLQ